MSTRYGGLAVTQGLVVCYDFGNAKSYVSGGALIDVSYNGNNASQNPVGTSFVGASGAYLFPPSAFAIFSTSTVIPADFTIQTVIKPQDNRPSVAVWGGTVYPITGMALGFGQQANTYSFYQYTNSGNCQIDFGTMGLTVPDVITIVHSGTNYLAYQNGVLKGSATGLYQPLTAATRLGGMTNGQWSDMTGYFYSMYVYSRALSQAEVSQNYAAMKGRFALP